MNSTEIKPSKEFTSRIAKVAEAIAATIFSAIFLILVNVFHDDISLLREEFKQILPLYNISIIISFVFSLSRVFIRSKQYKQATTIINNVIFFFIAYKVWTIFPFDTSVIGDQATWDKVFRAGIALVSFAVLIGTITELIKLISTEASEEEETSLDE